MIPTREQIQEKVNDYWSKHLHDPNALRSYIKIWLDEIDCPETATIASQQVNPKDQILNDLVSYIRPDA